MTSSLSTTSISVFLILSLITLLSITYVAAQATPDATPSPSPGSLLVGEEEDDDHGLWKPSTSRVVRRDDRKTRELSKSEQYWSQTDPPIMEHSWPPMDHRINGYAGHSYPRRPTMPKSAIKVGVPTNTFNADKPPELLVASVDDDSADWDDTRPHNTSFFLPEYCPTDYKTCCPTYNDEICGGVTRGSCLNFTVDNSVCDVTNGLIGLWWIRDFFDYVCVCNGNYWGAACEECKPGYEGDDCMTAKTAVVRRDFATLSDVDKQYVIDGWRLTRVTPHPYRSSVSLFDYWAVLHRWSLPGGANLGIDYDLHPELIPYGIFIVYGHIGTGAIMYHRTIVNGLERAIQIALQNDSFALPYWNWTGSHGNDNDLTLKWFGGDGDTSGDTYAASCRDRASLGTDAYPDCHCEVTRGPFASWPIIGAWGYPLEATINRGFGCNTLYGPSLPSSPTVDCVTAVTQFENGISADGALEGGHDIMLRTQNKIKQQSKDIPQVEAGENGDGTVVADTDDSTTNTGSHPVFHNLLGGGAACGTTRTWPNAFKFSDMHERVHRWMAGSIVGHHPGSDPLFYMMHNYADLVFEMWIRNTQSQGLFGKDNSWAWVGETMGNGRDECQGPMYPLRTQWSTFIDSTSFGVDWDFFETHDVLREGYEISEPSRQVWFFDGTSSPITVDRSSEPNPTDRYLNDQGQTGLSYGWESASSFNPGFEDELAEAIEVPLVNGETAPKDIRFFQPVECLDTDDMCCPEVDGVVCGGTVRGSCQTISSTYTDEDVTDLWWFDSYYSQACVCNDNYFGAACEGCAPGYEGDDCMTKSEVRVRRDFSTLTDDDKQYIIDTFRAAKTYPSAFQPSVSIIDFYASSFFAVQWPSLSFDPLLDSSLAETVSTGGGWDVDSKITSPVSAGSGAVLYYRALLLQFERELAGMTGNKSFALPYWDWSGAMLSDNDMTVRWFGGDGSMAIDSGEMCRVATFDGRGGCTCQLERVFHEWSVPTLWGESDEGVSVQRSFGCLGRLAPHLPTRDVVEYALEIETFWSSKKTIDSFARYLTGRAVSMGSWPAAEGGDMLARVLNWIGGTSVGMEFQDFRTVVSNSAADPLFWMSIGMADRILEQWMRLQGDLLSSTMLPTGKAIKGINADDYLPGIVPLVTNTEMFKFSTEFGYTFDIFDMPDYMFMYAAV